MDISFFGTGYHDTQIDNDIKEINSVFVSIDNGNIMVMINNNIVIQKCMGDYFNVEIENIEKIIYEEVAIDI